MTTWNDRFSALALLDGDEWEAEHERLKAEWCAAYSEAFVSVAVGRGWQREDAERWPEHIVDEAFIETYKHDCDPQKIAALDVIACEAECE